MATPKAYKELRDKMFNLRTDEQRNSFEAVFNGDGAMKKRLDPIALTQVGQQDLAAKAKSLHSARLDDTGLQGSMGNAARKDRAGKAVTGVFTADHGVADLGYSDKAWQATQWEAGLLRHRAKNNGGALARQVNGIGRDMFDVRGDEGANSHAFQKQLLKKTQELQANVDEALVDTTPDKADKVKAAKKAQTDFKKMTDGFKPAQDKFKSNYRTEAHAVSEQANRITGTRQYNDIVAAKKKDVEMDAGWAQARQFILGSGVGLRSFTYKKEHPGTKMPNRINIPALKEKRGPDGKPLYNEKTGEKLWEMEFDKVTKDVLPYLSGAERTSYFKEVINTCRAAGKETYEITENGKTSTDPGNIMMAVEFMEIQRAQERADPSIKPANWTEYYKKCANSGASSKNVKETLVDWLPLPTHLKHYLGGNHFGRMQELQNEYKGLLEKHEKYLQGELTGDFSGSIGALGENQQDYDREVDGHSATELRDLAAEVKEPCEEGAADRVGKLKTATAGLNSKFDLLSKRMAILIDRSNAVAGLPHNVATKDLLNAELVKARVAGGATLVDAEKDQGDTVEEAKLFYQREVMQPEVNAANGLADELQLEKEALDEMVYERAEGAPGLYWTVGEAQDLNAVPDRTEQVKVVTGLKDRMDGRVLQGSSSSGYTIERLQIAASTLAEKVTNDVSAAVDDVERPSM